MKPLGELFLERKQSRRLGVDVREASRKPQGREASPTPTTRENLIHKNIATARVKKLR